MTDPLQPVSSTVSLPRSTQAESDLSPVRDGPVAPSPWVRQALRPVGFDSVTLDAAGLLGSWQRRNADATLPHCVDQLEVGGALPNLRRPAHDGGPHVGMWFSDSDVYKTLEAMAWRLAVGPDAALAASFEAIVDVLEAAQEPDGYLNSYFQHTDPARRWQELSSSHELYCAGHLIQAAVAAQRAGLGARLMPIARRFADLIVARFGSSGEDAVCGHPEIETALVELYRATGHEPYLEMARRFIELRGHGLLGEGQFGAAYFQDHAPVLEATEFTGHAVRQLYLLAGVVDVAVETEDGELLAAAERLWRSAFGTKTYVTGGHGSRHRDEAVGDPYELPADRSYAETCAAIGSFQWNWRMLLATGAHRYAEEMERALYNAIAAATSLDGRHFFYSNTLHLRTGHDGAGEDAPSRRLPWYGCACCPPNLARLIGSLHNYLVTADEGGLQVHQYASCRVERGPHSVRIATDYPWDGAVQLNVESRDKSAWTLALRVPAWCTRFTVHIDGVAVPVEPVDGYIRLTRAWNGQTLELRLEMPPRLVAPHPRIDAVRGCVSLARGPLVYAFEQVDLPPGTVLEDVALDPAVPVRLRHDHHESAIPLLLDGCGRDQPGESTPLYHPHHLSGAAPSTPITLTAVPYFLWGNRRPGPMRVWIPTCDPTGLPPRTEEGVDIQPHLAHATDATSTSPSSGLAGAVTHSPADS